MYKHKNLFYFDKKSPKMFEFDHIQNQLLKTAVLGCSVSSLSGEECEGGFTKVGLLYQEIHEPFGFLCKNQRRFFVSFCTF